MCVKQFSDYLPHEHQTFVTCLCASHQETEGDGAVRKSQRHGAAAAVAKKDTNLSFPLGTPVEQVLQVTLTDMILETEEKLHVGMLGNMTHPLAREEWRNALVAGSLPTPNTIDFGGKNRIAQLKVRICE